MNDFVQYLPEIIARLSYIDTVQTWTASPLLPDQLEFLRDNCGGVRVFSETLRNRPDLRRRYLIQQPSLSALEILCQNVSYDHLVNRVDVALDLIVADANEAQKLSEFFLRHLVQRWHGRRHMTLFNGTAYASQDRWTARNFVQYSDQPSKVTGGACLHIELRFMGAAACRRAGIEFCEDLLDLDHRALWSRELCLRAMDPKRLDRKIDEVVGNVLLRQPKLAASWQSAMAENLTKREAVRRRIKKLLAMALSIEGGPKIERDTLHLAPAQRWIEAGPVYAKRCLIPIPIDQFLPDHNEVSTLIK